MWAKQECQPAHQITLHLEFNQTFVPYIAYTSIIHCENQSMSLPEKPVHKMIILEITEIGNQFQEIKFCAQFWQAKKIYGI